MSDLSPCLSCGACCSFFRVSFYWGECQSAGGIVPDQLTSQVNAHYVCMTGTESTAQPKRCKSLLGTIGEEVRCTVYENRPSPCRDFKIHGELGVANNDCNRARAAFGLPPLDMPPLIDQPLPIYPLPEVI